MGLFRDKDGTGNQGNQAPELVIGWGKSEGAMNQLVEEQASPGSGQGKADNAVIVAMPKYLHFLFSTSRLMKNQPT